MKTLLRATGLILTVVVMTSVASLTKPRAAFEGVIEFTKTSGPVVSKYKYFIKNQFVRIEEINKAGKIEGIMLVDTKANTVTALSPERGLYMEVPNNRAITPPATQVTKMKNRKEIAGYQCSEWKVVSKEQDREMTYWVADGSFEFFIPLLKTLNRKDKQAVFFLTIDGAEGVFPFVGVEQKMDGTEVSTLEVTKVTAGTVDEANFVIDKSKYQKFEK